MCIWPRCCGAGNMIKIRAVDGVFETKPQWQKSVVTRSFFNFLKANKTNIPDSQDLTAVRGDMNLSTNASPSGTIGRNLYCLRIVQYDGFFVVLTYVDSGPDINAFAIQKWTTSGLISSEVLVLTSGFTWDASSKDNMFPFWDDENDTCGFVTRNISGTSPAFSMNLEKYSWAISDGSSYGAPATSSTTFRARVDVDDDRYAVQDGNKLVDTFRFDATFSSTDIVVADFMTDDPASIGQFVSVYQETGTTSAFRNRGTKHSFTLFPTPQLVVDIDANTTATTASGASLLDDFGQVLRNSAGRTQRWVEGTGWVDYVVETDFSSHTIEVHPAEDTPISTPIMSAGPEGVVSSNDASLIKIGTVPNDESPIDLLIGGIPDSDPGFAPAVFLPGMSAIVPYIRSSGVLNYAECSYAGVVPASDGIIIMIDYGSGSSIPLGQLLVRFGYFTLVPPEDIS